MSSTWLKNIKGDVNDGLVTIDPKIREKFNNLSKEKKEASLKAVTFILYPFELNEQQQKPFEQKEIETIDFIINHLKQFDKPYIATSFGSDSIILMHIVMRACNKLCIKYPDMILMDTLNTFKEEKAYWEKIQTLWKIKNYVRIIKPPKDKEGKQQTVWSIANKVGHLPIMRQTNFRNKKSKTSRTQMEIGGQGLGIPECCNILKKDGIKEYMKTLPIDKRYNCCFVGTRAEESKLRAMSVLQRCRTYMKKWIGKDKIRVVTPLSYWLQSDIENYYKKYDIPKNPAYKAHDMKRMGCSSCPAHKNWEIRLAQDPTEEGFGMLRQNLLLTKKFIENNTENKFRLINSVNVLKEFLKDSNQSGHLSLTQKQKIIKIIKEFNEDTSIEDYV